MSTGLSFIIRRTHVLVGLLLLATLLLQPDHSYAATDWPVEIKVSNRDGENSYQPSIALDNDGFTHIAWYGGDRQENWSVFYTNNRSGRFAAPRVISTAAGGEHRGVDLAVGSDGSVHVVAARRFDGQSEINYMESRDLGANWESRIRNISNSSGSAFEPSVALDSDNNVYFAWIDNRVDEYRIWFTCRVGGVYGQTIQLSRTTFDKNPQLLITGPAGNRQFHVVFQGRSPRDDVDSAFEIYYARGQVVSDLEGKCAAQVSSLRQMTIEATPYAITPAFASDGGSNLFLAYDRINNANHDIWFTRSADGGSTWTSAVNITGRSNGSYLPALAYGIIGGRPTVTLGWEEGSEASNTNALAVEFYLDTGQFGNEQAKISVVRDAGEVALASNAVAGRVAAAFQGLDTTRRIFATLRGNGPTPTPTATTTPLPTLAATVQINAGAEATRNPRLTLSLSNVSGNPTQMRYAADRVPNEADSLVPFTNTFELDIAPDSARCTRSVAVQVCRSGSDCSPVVSDTIILDSAVQVTATITTTGSFAPGYTNLGSVLATVRPNAECTALAGTLPVLDADGNGGFAGSLPLPSSPLPGFPDGIRNASLVVSDIVGNQLTVTQAVTVDTTAPSLVTGTLTTPALTLTTLVTNLVVNGLVVTDALYPDGFWGVEVAPAANVTGTLDLNRLSWQRATVERGVNGTLTLRNVSVVSGLSLPEGLNPVGLPITLAVRFVDGAGNPSSGVLTGTVTLGVPYVQNRLPLIVRR